MICWPSLCVIPLDQRRVDLVAPYSNHLERLKTAQIVLTRIGPETSMTDEPDLGLLTVEQPGGGQIRTATDICRQLPTPDRLDQGADAWDQAELLTQLTGEPAVVQPLDTTPGSEGAVAAELKAQLDANKPVLVGVSGPQFGGPLRHNLIGGHAYEVVSIDNGQVQLWNPGASTTRTR